MPSALRGWSTGRTGARPSSATQRRPRHNPKPERRRATIIALPAARAAAPRWSRRRPLSLLGAVFRPPPAPPRLCVAHDTLAAGARGCKSPTPANQCLDRRRMHASRSRWQQRPTESAESVPPPATERAPVRSVSQLRCQIGMLSSSSSSGTSLASPWRDRASRRSNARSFRVACARYCVRDASKCRRIRPN